MSPQEEYVELVFVWYRFDCSYKSGGTAKVIVDETRKEVDFSRNGGYVLRLKDMPIDIDFLLPRFDSVTCVKCVSTDHGISETEVDPVSTWEYCINSICSSPTLYRKHRDSIRNLAKAFWETQEILEVDEETKNQFFGPKPEDGHPMAGKSSCAVSNNKPYG